MVPDDTSQRGLDYTCDNDLDRSDLSPSMQLALNYHATRSELLRVHSSVMTYEVRKKEGTYVWLCTNPLTTRGSSHRSGSQNVPAESEKGIHRRLPDDDL